MTLNEVAPPGFGHTKGDKEKGVKKGGTAAAFDRARKEGRFKGSKSDMFAIMWSQKNKGDKPHYKPGTNKKYKKYQDESFEIDKSAHKTAQKKAKLRNLAKGNTNPNEKAAAEKKAGGPKLYGEAKVDQGRSDYGKASIRNYRRAGPGHGEPAMFDPENKRGKLIDKRREEHKARRGVKNAKVPA